MTFVKPEGAFYLLADVSYYIGKSHDGIPVENDVSLCEYLLDTAHVALVPGDAFGAGGFVRIAYATSGEVLSEALDAMEKALLELN